MLIRSATPAHAAASISPRTYPSSPPRLAVALALLFVTWAGLAGCRPGSAPPPTAARPARQEPIPVLQPVPSEGLAAYAGSAACAGCHADQAGQLESSHARTLARAGGVADRRRFGRSNERRDPFLGIRYHTEARDGRCRLVAREGGERSAIAPKWAFGSGHRGVTYTGAFEGKAVELRLSYYAAERRWEFTPSQEVEFGTRPMTPVGLRLEPGMETRCFQCHATALVRDGERVQPERSILGVGCEVCHGPGAAHVAAVQRGDRDLRIAPLKGDPARVTLALCGQCHRSPTDSNPHDPQTAAQLPRFQGLALSLSDCFTKSEGRLSCMSCHNPHRDAERGSNSGYNTTCRSCHTPATPAARPASRLPARSGGAPAAPTSGSRPARACKRAPEGDCVSCHMPLQPVHLPTSPRFRTHWIKVWEELSGG